MTYDKGTKWDKGKFSKKKPITDEDKKAITKYYQAGQKIGTPVEGILEFLFARYGRSTRQIQRYVSEMTKAQESRSPHAVVEQSAILQPPYEDQEQDLQAIEKEDRELSPVTSKPPAVATVREKFGPCQSPPDNIDVTVLKSWGVPAKEAADILYRWRKLHRSGSHQLCLAFRTFEDNLKNHKIPFRQAELYLNAELHARKFNIDDALSDLERSRKYRIWERPEYHRAFINETRDLMKPMLEARQKHLKKIENLLKELQDNVLTSLTTKKYDNLLKMEENPLFESLQTHCYDVYDFFWDLKRNLETAQYLESDKTTSEIDKTMDNSKRKELLKLQKDTITSIKQLRKAIDYTLNNKSFSREWCPDCYHDATIETNP